MLVAIFLTLLLTTIIIIGGPLKLQAQAGIGYLQKKDIIIIIRYVANGSVVGDGIS
jgi:hypothetical protein